MIVRWQFHPKISRLWVSRWRSRGYVAFLRTGLKIAVSHSFRHTTLTRDIAKQTSTEILLFHNRKAPVETFRIAVYYYVALSTVPLLFVACSAWPNSIISRHTRVLDALAYNTTAQNTAWLVNGTELAIAGILSFPNGQSHCNSSSGTLDRTLISDIISIDVASSTLNRLVPQGGDSMRSRLPATGIPGMRVFNYNQYNMAHNVAHFNRVNDMLNDKCGDARCGILFLDWELLFGRDNTYANEDGSLRDEVSTYQRCPK